PLDRKYDETLAESDVIVFEVFEEDNSKNQKAILEFIQKKAFYPPGKNLKEVMGEKEFFLLDSFYKSRGIMHFAQTGLTRRPWLLMLELTMITAQEMGLKGEYGFEEVFKKLRNGRPARGLESAGSQLSLLEGTDEKILCRMLTDGVKDSSIQKEELKNILHSFHTGDMTALSEQTEKTAKKYPVFYKRLLLTRNYNMTEKLIEYSNEKKTFFILIGAAHFAGNGNILQLLKAKGFVIKQLAKTGKKGGITGEEE
ncbi:MAG: TraB/GumN family protein, partial [Lentisphaeria bacterium]|nr:TraB/GumN family protein [Lentisphaeria bacterium]